jgi:hypothetical protein
MTVRDAIRLFEGCVQPGCTRTRGDALANGCQAGCPFYHGRERDPVIQPAAGDVWALDSVDGTICRQVREVYRGPQGVPLVRYAHMESVHDSVTQRRYVGHPSVREGILSLFVWRDWVEDARGPLLLDDGVVWLDPVLPAASR